MNNLSVEDNLKLVYSLVHKVLYPQFKEALSKDELIQIGTLGLMSAISRYDPSKNTKFATYASKFVIGYVYNYIHADRFRYTRNLKTGKFDRVIITSLDSPIAKPGKQEDLTLLDCLEYEEVSYALIEMKDLMKHALTCLNERERTVIHCIYVLEYSTTKTGKTLGYSQSYISRISGQAIIKLRKYMEREGFVNERKM